jgi:FAD/FMN-containing dehydrogenase
VSPELLDEFRQLLGPAGVVAEGIRQRPTDGWGHQNCFAGAILRPANTRELSEIMKRCADEGQKVVTHGGCTNMTGGCDAGQSELVISLERMNAIESVDVDNRTMVAQAGVPLQAIQERAEAEGLFFALDLGARGSATIGGNIATNAGGNQVIRYGMAREQVLGLEVVLADGRVLSSMNQMLKNNAGFDLKQLFFGSEGTLGIITRAVLRLRPSLPVSTTAMVATDHFAHMPQLLNHMDRALGGKLSAFETLWQSYYRIACHGEHREKPPLPDNYPFYILLESSGVNADEDRQLLLGALEGALEKGLICDAVLAESGQQQQSLWAIRDNIPALLAYHPMILFDISLPIGAMERYLVEMEDNIRAIDPALFVATLGHLGDGNLHVAVQLGEESPQRRRAVELAVYEPLRQRGGSISGEHGIGLEKKPYLSLCRSEVEITVMKQLKQLFDPQCLLNCGKVI